MSAGSPEQLPALEPWHGNLVTGQMQGMPVSTQRKSGRNLCTEHPDVGEINTLGHLPASWLLCALGHNLDLVFAVSMGSGFLSISLLLCNELCWLFLVRCTSFTSHM